VNQDERRSFDVRLAAERRPASSSACPGEWFADEVAIDFPSVDSVVDRMRETFLGPEDADTLRAELRLSPREAFDGVIVPLAVPLRRTCEPCGGRGEVWTEPCVACRGTGHAFFRHQVRMAVPAGVTDGARFRFRISTPHAPTTRVEIRIAVG
jgi:hypothetical protein